MNVEQVHDIDLKDIDISVLNVRESQPKKDIDELAASIKKHGLLQPVVLRGNLEDGPPFELIAGQRRYHAHDKLKKKSIKAVFTGPINDRDATVLSLIENLQAVKLNNADTARAVTKLYEDLGKDEKKVQKETGLSIRRIRDYLTVQSQASPAILEKLKDKEVSIADVKRVLRAAQGNLDKAEKLLELMGKHKLTRHQKRRIEEFGEEHPKASAKKIIEEAQRPRIEQSIMVSLPEAVRAGLESATIDLSRDAEDIVADALETWLVEQGFINE